MERKEYSAGAVKLSFWFVEFRKVVQLLHDEKTMDEVKALAERLEVINLQFARRKAVRRADLHWLLIAVCGGILAVAAVLAAVNSPYLGWDYSAPETAVMGVAIHAFEWGFVRLAPFALIAAMVGVFLTRKKHKV